MKLAIAGCTGRMGQALIRIGMSHPETKIVAGSIRSAANADEARLALTSLGAGHITLTDSPAELFAEADAVIDFTTPDVSLMLASHAAEQNKIHIIGTTGFSEVEMQQLQGYAKTARIVWSYNMSLGVNVVAALVEKAAQVLGIEYDIDVHESHHRHKKDLPSGTAYMLGKAAANGRDVTLEEAEYFYKQGLTGPRKEGTIGFSANRLGEIVGEHQVMFAGPGEIIEISHRAFNRNIFAQGALKAALWVVNQPCGVYTMKEVLDL